MNRKICIVSNLFLLLWFFLDMIGMKIDGQILVTRSYREDGIFFLAFLVLFIWFFFKEKRGKYFLTVLLLMWFIAQFLSHWYYTIFGPYQGKINYFADTIKLIPSNSIYIPDLYHIVLHILIFISLINMMLYCNIFKKQNRHNS